MFFDAVPPDTSIYMIAGYSLFFLFAAIYLVSLIVRNRNLERDLQTLLSIEQESQAAAPAVKATPKRKTVRAKSSKRAQPARKTARRK